MPGIVVPVSVKIRSTLLLIVSTFPSNVVPVSSTIAVVSVCIKAISAEMSAATGSPITPVSIRIASMSNLHCSPNVEAPVWPEVFSSHTPSSI